MKNKLVSFAQNRQTLQTAKLFKETLVKFCILLVFILSVSCSERRDTIIETKTFKEDSIPVDTTYTTQQQQYKTLTKERAEKEESLDGFYYFDITSKLIPILVIIVTLAGIFIQIRARKKEFIKQYTLDRKNNTEQNQIDRKNTGLQNQLNRLSKQISNFYGPMYSLYETGHRNFYIYLKNFGAPVDFDNPHDNFKLWTEHVFESTNSGMEKLIINNVDLILGKSIPECFLQFCKWSSMIKVYKQAYFGQNYENDIWKAILNENPHPEVRMQMYLKASFEVLKEEQNRLLLGGQELVNENALLTEINSRTESYILESKNPETWENQIWAGL